MLVVAWNRSPIVPDLRCETMALYELLTIADAASIRLALTPKTHRFFDAARGRHFKRGVLLVKVANGALY